GAETRRNGSEDFVERALSGPEELVRIAVDDPVGAVFGGGEASHSRHPLALAQCLVVLVDKAQAAAPLELAQDVRRAVDRAVVGGDDEVDAVVEVVAKVVRYEIGLVPHEQRHDDLQGLPSVRAVRRRTPRASVLSPRSRRTGNEDSTR